MRLINIIKFIFTTVMCLSYNLLNHKYKSADIDIYVSCPKNIECSSMLFNANYLLHVPGSYFNINWHFLEKTLNDVHNNGLNDIIFTYDTTYKGKTIFKKKNEYIVEFNSYISLYKTNYIELYNIILHEMGHIYLLNHSEYSDSIMGYVIFTKPDGESITSNLLGLTTDDCNGLYHNLIQNKQYEDILYTEYLIQIRDVYCNRLPNNKLISNKESIG